MGFLFGGVGGPNAKSLHSYSGLQVQSSASGMVITVIYGQARIPGNLLWYGNFKKHEEESSAGKGGSMGTVTYSYKTGAIVALCWGEIWQIGTVWRNKKQTTLDDLGAVAYLGTDDQDPDVWLQGYEPAKALSYRRIAYIINSAWKLGNSPDFPVFSFDVYGKFCTEPARDINPAVVINDFLSSPLYGPGFSCLAALTTFQSYCQAMGFNISPVFDSQKPAASHIGDIVIACNASWRWYNKELDIIPYGDTALDANGAVYTPPTPVADLTRDDFLYNEGEAPVKIRRKRRADAYNMVKIEYLERDNQYNPDVAPASDLSAIELYGLRPAPVISSHFFCNADPAMLSAQLTMQRQHILNTYQFKLDCRYINLRVMDLVTLTDVGLHLDHQWTRITEMEEDEEYGLTITCEDYLQGIGHAQLYAKQAAEGAQPDMGKKPDNCYHPVIFEPPPELCASSVVPEIWILVSGKPKGDEPDKAWGGCYVWAVLDVISGTYQYIGQIEKNGKTGQLTASLPSGDPVDTTHTLKIKIDNCELDLASATPEEAQAGNSLCYVDGELLSYDRCSLVNADPKKYELGKSDEFPDGALYRGQYGSVIDSHPDESDFARLDNALFKMPYTNLYKGQTIKFKFQGYNIYGGGLQNIDDVTEYPYTIVGISLVQVQRGTAVTLDSGWLTVTYPVEFENKPNLQITIVDSVEGDTLHLQNQSKSSFQAKVKDSGNDMVVRNINWVASL